MAKVSSVRGLKNYIQEIRNCSTKETEKERIDKELGKIRKKYTSDKTMKSYDRRKYMWKLLYTHMLGYDVDFGHKQAMDLMAASGYSDKQVGYVVCSIFLTERDELLRLVINTVRNDLLSRNETFQCLALDFIANVGGAEFASLLTGDVAAVLGNGATRPAVRKKAALCLLRLLRKAPSDANVLPPEVWGVRLATLLEERDLGVQLGLTTLLLGVVARSYDGFEPAVPRLVRTLSRCVARDVPQDYTYYGLASPWLQVRVLRCLQYFPPPRDPAVRAELREALRACLSAQEPARNANKANAVHAIALEAVAVAVADEDPELAGLGASLLARFLAAREPNLRCLALGALARLSGAPGVPEAVARHARTVRACLSDPDASIARSALDLLFALCGRGTARELVGTLLEALPDARPELRHDLVLKAAVLAERFMPEPAWFVDVALRLLAEAGDDAPADLWHSLVHVVTNGDGPLHIKAARGAAAYLAGSRPLPEAFLKPAAHLLGEYASTASGATADVPDASGVSGGPAPLGIPLTPALAFRLLAARIPGTGEETRALFLTAARKLASAAPEDEQLQAVVRETLARDARALDPDLQQRALEYLALDEASAKEALAPLPAWEARGSLLLRRLAQANAADADEAAAGPAWAREDGDGAPSAGTPPSSARALGVDLAGVAAGAGAGAAAPPVPEPSREPSDLLDLLDLSGPSEPASGDVGVGAPPLAVGQFADPFAAPAAAYGLPAAARVAAVDPFAAPAPRQPPLGSAYGQQPGVPPPPPPAHAAWPAADTRGAAPLGAAAPPAPTPPPPEPAYADATPTGSVAAWYARLAAATSGILYEDAQLQAGLRLSTEGGTVRLGLFLGNKAPSALEDVVVALSPGAGGIAVRLEPGQAPPPSVIEAGKQIRIGIEASAPGGAPLVPGPSIRLAYRSPATRTRLDVTLALPLHAGRFAQGVDVPPQIFLARWAQVPGPPHKIRAPLSDPTRAFNLLRAVPFLKEVPGVDADPAGSASAACVVSLGAPSPRPVPCMVKVESSAPGEELAVAAADVAVAAAVLDILKVLLG